MFGSVLYQSIEQSYFVGSDGQKQEEISENSGLGDAELGLKYQWFSDSYVLSSSLLVKLPCLYDEAEPFALGNGQEDIEFKMLLGKSLNEYGYFGLELGYRHRIGSPSDEYRYLVEYGFDLNENIYLRAKLDGILSAGNGDDMDDLDMSTGNLSTVPEFDQGKLELTGGWKFDQGWGAELTFSREIYGENILQGNSLQFGITKVY